MLNSGIVGGTALSTGYSSYGTGLGYGSTIPSVGYSGLGGVGYSGLGSGIGSVGYGTTVTSPRRFGLLRRFAWRRDPILGGRQHFIRRWRNASPVLGGPVRHSSMFYGGYGYGGFGMGGLSMWQRLKMRLGFGRVHYGAGSTITGNSGLGVAPTII